MRYNHFDMLPERAFRPVGKRMTLEGGGKGDAPSTPDYAGAAQATAQGNLDAARVAAKANRVSQYTPYGNLVYKQGTGDPVFNNAAYEQAKAAYDKQMASYIPTVRGPFGTAAYNNYVPNNAPKPTAPNINDFYTTGDMDTWTATQTLSPAEQAKLDKNNALSLGLLDTAQLGLGGVNEALSKGFNWDSLPASQINAGQTAQDAIMSRLNPKYAQDEETLRTRLTNQGVRAGSQAWDREFNNFNQGKNDAFIQAGLQGIDVGNKARQQAIQEQEFGRTEGLNMVNALRTGNQVQNPNFINTPQQATTQGADLLGAAQGQYQSELGSYNAKQAANNGFLGGLGSLAGAGAQMWMMSDARLKTNIKRIGTHDETGVGIYSYIKFGKPEIGVIAQELEEIMPNAVSTHESGFKQVNYGVL